MVFCLGDVRSSLTTLPSPRCFCSEINGCRVLRVRSGRARGTLDGRGKKKASSDIKRRNFLVRSMPISVKSLSGPRLFIFQACELMGGSRRCSELLITPIKFVNLGDFSSPPPPYSPSPAAILPTPPLLPSCPLSSPPTHPTSHPTVALQSGGQWTCCKWPSFGCAWLPWTHSSHTYTLIHAHKWGRATLGLTLIWF